MFLTSMTFARSAATKDGQTASALAVEKGHLGLYGSSHLSNVLRRSARIIGVTAMKSCIAEGAKVNGRDQNRCTPLHRRRSRAE